MNQEFSIIADEDCSFLQIEVDVTESWIDRFISGQELTIQVSDAYTLVNLKANLEEGKLTMLADIQEKEGSSIQITCFPKWDVGQQQIQLEDLKIDTLSKNILLKSAGWFAKTFMSAKIDKKIEEATAKLYTQQLNKILTEGISIPIKKGGSADVQVKSITITEMLFLDHNVKVKAMVEGIFKLQLDTKG